MTKTTGKGLCLYRSHAFSKVIRRSGGVSATLHGENSFGVLEWPQELVWLRCCFPRLEQAVCWSMSSAAFVAVLCSSWSVFRVAMSKTARLTGGPYSQACHVQGRDNACCSWQFKLLVERLNIQYHSSYL